MITKCGDETSILSFVGLLPKQILMISLASYNDHEDIIEVWEQSVRATFTFPDEKYLQEIKSQLSSALRHIKVYAYRAKDDGIKGFVGLKGHKVEMLFIRPEYFGQDEEMQLTNFCTYSLHVYELNVRERDESALQFYKNILPISNT